ncbi:glucose-6-phosphate isomerase [Acidobacteriota bacterium]
MQVYLDYTNALAETVGEQNGIPLQELQSFCVSAEPILEALKVRMEAGELGFAELPLKPELANLATRCASTLREFSDTLLVIGIGGSALGAQALQNAMEVGRKGLKWGNVLVLDNVDPERTGELIDRVDPSRTVVNVVTKSGGTAETIANFMVVHKLFADKLPADEMKKRFVITTAAEKGDLGTIAKEEGWEILPIPDNVGGRFSVLSPVGLLPAAYLGVDIEELLGGARGALQAVRQRKPSDNPALLSAAINVMLYKERKKTIRVFFPYARALYGLALWCSQLWAESLGKKVDRNGNAVWCGQTPVVALGAVDQHSQVQLYMEGPSDKAITFFEVTKFRREIKIPQVFPEAPSCAYLGGKSLNRLLAAEKTGTELALAGAGRPSTTFCLPTISPLIMGELFLLLEYETALAGELLQINAFDQPGVEQGKKNTYALMGRDGFEADRDTILEGQSSKRYKV